MVKNKLTSNIPLFAAALVAGGIIVFLVQTKDYKQVSQAPTNQNNEPVKAENEKPAEPVFNKKQLPIDSPDSLWVVVNKKSPLPASYVSRDLSSFEGVFLQADAANQIKELMEAARKDQIPLKIISGYRSYQTQKTLYQSYVRQDGQAAADTYSARAGFSEHQTGLATDLGNLNGTCDLQICFETTPGGIWLAAHVYEYGFIFSYPKDKTAVTGYQYEPWHLRYVGVELAAELKKTGQTMEEFFGLPAAPGY